MYVAGCHISLFLREELSKVDREMISHHLGRRVTFTITGLVSTIVLTSSGEKRLLFGFEAVSSAFHDIRFDCGLQAINKKQRFHATLLYVPL